MNTGRIKTDNRGASLILVVICAAFVMILSSVIFTATITNRQMKSVQHEAKKNFYITETAMNEIRAGLEEYIAVSLEHSYAKVLEQFTVHTQEQRQELLKEGFLDHLEARLSVVPGYYHLEFLEDFLKDTTGYAVTSGENRLIRDTNSITLKNVKVAYEDDQGYLTTISTDIIIHSPTVSFATTYKTPAFGDYGLIADKKIKLDGTGLASGAKVNGSVYSGENGISLMNSRLHISHLGHVVTRGDINVDYNSILKIDNNPSIWVKNISVNSDTPEEFEIQIDGKCYVADDLTINGNKSKVKIQGEYYGYSYESYHDGASSPVLTAQANSAIVINGKNGGLEFANMDSLLIAGRAFLSSRYAEDSSGIYTGESITAKELQMAYLVPEDFMWCGTNPVTYDEYLAKPVGVEEVDYSRSSTFPIDLEKYADGFLNLHYIIHGEKYRYYYLKFKSEAMANEYMQEYYEVFRRGSSDLINIDKQLENHMGSILIDNTVNNIFLTAGNIVTYDSYANLIGSNVEYGGLSLQAMEQLAKQLSKRYDSMSRNLEPVSTSPAFDDNSVFNSIIKTDTLDLSPYKTTYPLNLGGEICYVHIINNPGSVYMISDISASERKGIVIAKGSVCVDRDYRGLILAGEEVELKASVQVNADKDMVEDILRMGNPDINRYFRAYASLTSPTYGGSKQGISIGDMIEFINWKKNE